MKRLLLAVAVLALVAGFAPNAKADTVTLTPAQVGTLTFTTSLINGYQSANYIGTPACSPLTGVGASCGGQFDSTVVGTGTMVFQITGLNVHLNIGDVFALTIYNNNNSPWGFNVCGSTTEVGVNAGCIGLTTIANQTFYTFNSIPFQYDAHITGIQVVLYNAIPNGPNQDYGPDFKVYAPEPGTLSLLGAGLLGLAGLLRRRVS